MGDSSEACARCGFPAPIEQPLESAPRSDKSFAVAIVLCGIFGITGLHHFYLGNILHGLFDLGLFVGSMFCVFSGDPSLAMLGLLLILIDALHSIIIFSKLIAGKQLDGAGKLVTYPGQFGR